jgi:hypothetical protein
MRHQNESSFCIMVKTLDDLLSSCLGLACKNIYQIHRSMHGTVSISLQLFQAHSKTPAGTLDTAKGSFPGRAFLPLEMENFVKEWGITMLYQKLKERKRIGIGERLMERRWCGMNYDGKLRKTISLFKAKTTLKIQARLAKYWRG